MHKFQCIEDSSYKSTNCSQFQKKSDCDGNLACSFENEACTCAPGYGGVPGLCYACRGFLYKREPGSSPCRVCPYPNVTVARPGAPSGTTGVTGPNTACVSVDTFGLGRAELMALGAAFFVAGALAAAACAGAKRALAAARAAAAEP